MKRLGGFEAVFTVNVHSMQLTTPPPVHSVTAAELYSDLHFLLRRRVDCLVRSAVTAGFRLEGRRKAMPRSH